MKKIPLEKRHEYFDIFKPTSTNLDRETPVILLDDFLSTGATMNAEKRQISSFKTVIPEVIYELYT